MELGYIRSSVNDGRVKNGIIPIIPDQPISPSARPYSSLEIELSTRCTLTCPSCPRTTYSSSWIREDMTLETFEHIAPLFDYFRTVHFRGWGEPICNENFSIMVRRAHQSGARLVLSTNGSSPLDPELLPYFDDITFRLDFGRASLYERRNPHAKYNRTIFNISQVIHWRNSFGRGKPNIIILFAKNKYTLNHLPVFLETAAKFHPDRIVFYQPRFHVRQVDANGELPADVDMGLVSLIDDKLEAMAEVEGLNIVNECDYDLNGPTHHCTFNYDNSWFINWNGRLARCRFSALPVAGGTFTRFWGAEGKVIHTALFGSLLRSKFSRIVNGRACRQFSHSCTNDVDIEPLTHLKMHHASKRISGIEKGIVLPFPQK